MRAGIYIEELVGLYPLLYHMAADGSWPSIDRHGLLSTSALLDLFEVTGAEREAIEGRRRPESVVLTHAKHGKALVRDQKPMSDASVAVALAGTGLRPEDWYRFLNKRVFFWLTERRLDTMLNARPYRGHPHTVLSVDARALVTHNLQAITLSPMNSGATLPFPHPRSLSTFRPLTEYPFAELRARRQGRDVVVELAVEHSVPSISEYVVEVRLMQGSEVLRRLGP